jgi:protein-L-isoaspartate(D-aspartate) O-methyltransferase
MDSPQKAYVNRRAWLAGAAALGVATALPARTWADVPRPYDWNASPPMESRAAFVQWMQTNRGEDPKYLGQRYDRYQALVGNRDLWDDRNKRAYLMTPREEFVTRSNLGMAYEWHYLDIGYGVSITGPHTVARMTNALDVQMGDKVLEIGTGSGYQSAYLANLTNRVFSIEIIRPLFDRTGGVYADLMRRGYNEFSAVSRMQGDGYYGWQDQAPFDKVIVTCGIDHVPPPLLQQLKPNGVMVIPVGPPGAPHVLRIVKELAPDGTIRVTRSDIYNGRIVPFVPFTKLEGNQIVGTHNQ